MCVFVKLLFGLMIKLQMTNPANAPINPKNSGLGGSFGAMKYAPSVVTVQISNDFTKSFMLTRSSQTSIFSLENSSSDVLVCFEISCFKRFTPFLDLFELIIILTQEHSKLTKILSSQP